MVTLKTNPYDAHQPSPNNVGLQQIKSNNRNLFSCLDDGTGWEFMPYNFQTRTRQYYDNVSLGKTQSSTLQPFQPTGIHTVNEAPGTRHTGQPSQSIQLF